MEAGTECRGWTNHQRFQFERLAFGSSLQKQIVERRRCRNVKSGGVRCGERRPEVCTNMAKRVGRGLVTQED